MPPILSYCLNVHPGESLAHLLEVLRGPARRVREAWRGSRRMAAGLWLPRQTAAAIAQDDDAASSVRAALGESGLYAFSVNAFPMGGFHAERVKHDVYRPTWMDPRRLDYTRQACRALARLLPQGARGSVSTVPVGYPSFSDAGELRRAGAHLGELAGELLDLERTTGHELAIALEPEPCALLETARQTIAFLEEHVFGGAAREALIAAGCSRARAERELRRRIGICLDTCHLACVFESIPDALAALRRAGVRVVKAQLSSALELREPLTNAPGRRRLQAFVEPRYLHQTRGDDGSRAEDLDAVLDAAGELRPEFAQARTLRSHFHVPLCWPGDAELHTTRPSLEEALHAVAESTDHLEVETYTFAVLPAAQRERYGGDVVEMIVQELRWAEAALAARGVELA